MANPSPAPAGPPADRLPGTRWPYGAFLWRLASQATDGSPLFYAWMTFLTAVALVGAHGWATQVHEGMIVTHMTDQVSWGLYIANFTFLVGLAAGAVIMVIPAYLYGDEEMHDVVIVGELLAVAAIAMSLMFVIADLGRPDRFWHLLPGLGRFHWPASMLTWDVVVLSGYLLLNLHVTGYLLYCRFLGRTPRPAVYVPFVLLSIAWAVSIHTVTAFLYQGLGGRPFWNTALLAPRFIASAFVTGPAFLIATFHLASRWLGWSVPKGPLATLLGVLRVTVLVNLFMVASEAFTQFYGGGTHAAAARYLFFGEHGHGALVPWIWSALALNTAGAVILLWPRLARRTGPLLTACAFVFVGVWIEKGMGLIVPAFVPSTLHELVEYTPSLTEWRVSAGIWAVGLGVFSLALRAADLARAPRPETPAEST